MNTQIGFEFDHINHEIIMTKKFYKAASSMGTPEYKALMEARTQNPNYTMKLREIKKKAGKKSYRNLTYKNMEDFIIAQEGEDSASLNELHKVMELSKVQAGPYAYVKTWFLKKYKDHFKSEEEAADETNNAPDLKLVKQ